MKTPNEPSKTISLAVESRIEACTVSHNKFQSFTNFSVVRSQSKLCDCVVWSRHVWCHGFGIGFGCIRRRGDGMPSQYHRFSVASRTQPRRRECVRVRSSKCWLRQDLICFLVFASRRTRHTSILDESVHITSDCFMNPIHIITESKQEPIISNVLCCLPRVLILTTHPISEPPLPHGDVSHVCVCV